MYSLIFKYESLLYLLPILLFGALFVSHHLVFHLFLCFLLYLTRYFVIIFLFLCPFIMFWFFLILFLVHFLTSSFLSLCLRCTVFLPPLSVPYINLLRFKIYCLLFWAFYLWSLYGCYNDSFCISLNNALPEG